MLWKPGNGDAEVVAMVFLDVSNEIDPMDEAALNRLPDVFTDWWVPPESENIAAPMLLGGLGKESMFHSRATMESDKKRTVRAMSIFSGCMLVHVRCIHVSRPIVS